MHFIDGIIINILYVLFPIMIYMIFISYKKDHSLGNNIILSIMLVTSLYFIIRFDNLYDLKFCIVLCNIPLLISYLKNLKTTNIVLSMGILFYYHQFYHFNFYMLMIEYFIYFFVYVVVRKNKLNYRYLINSFVLIKSFVLSFQEFALLQNYHTFFSSFLYVLFLMLCFYCISYVVFYLLDHVEQLLNLNNTLKELEKEKVLRSSLFKLTHEIKNPIAVCKGYLDMMNTNDLVKIKKYLPIIKSEINRTLVIMDDFLDYSKIKVEKDIIDMNVLIEDTLEALNYLFKKNNIVIKSDLFDDDTYVNGDYNRLKQVLVNVFKNAIEAKKEDMIIKLHTKVMKDQFVIEICDNGIGTDSETLSKVYDTFYTTKKNGTGLGVAISKEIIELHHGKINYESEFGKGTKVTIQLPIYKEI